VNRAFAFLLILGLAACGSDDGGATSPTTPQGELVIVDLVVGDGPVAETGDSAAVHYVGRLANGTQFDSSYDRGEVYPFLIGAGKVIPGWDLGVPGMRVGGQRRLTIPPHLAYGSNGFGPIPPNATLIFDIELVELVGK
jgi:FKBP-type peptidyl-prolyl cis-trans isomerase